MKKNYYRQGRLLLILSFLLTFSTGYSQLQLGVVPAGGTAGNSNGSSADPISDFYNSIRYQVVYTAAELNTAGFLAGDVISALAWDVTEAPGTLNDYTISMGHTTATNSAVHDASPTTVVKNAFAYIPAVGQTDVVFDANFTWNGTDNILVEICTGPSNPYSTPYGGVTVKSGITNGSRYVQADASGSQCGVVTSTTSSLKPNIRFTIFFPTPPTPVQAGGTPTCASGSTIDLPGSPATGMTWYWQTSATGTSTATPYVGPLAITANGTYYARAFNTPHNSWSAATSLVVTNFPTATTPMAPTAAANPACVPGTTISMPAAPVGTAYYWQGTVVNGSSNANPATVPYNVTATGTYTVAAYETATQCWSSTSSITVTVESNVPAAPTTATTNYNICGGTVSQQIVATGPPLPYSTTIPLGTNMLSTGDAPAVYTTAIPALPAGATVTSAQILLTNVQAMNGSYRSEIRVATGGLYTLAPTQISTAASGGVISPDPTINLSGFPATGGNLDLIFTESYNDTGVDDATFGGASLTINYTLPGPITWYDAATGGNVIGTGTPFETIGTSVLPAAGSSASYSFYAGGMQGACPSATRLQIVVNVTAVLATLTPVNITCNGLDNGTWTLGAVTCGTPPFTYSVDGGAFLPIQNNLTPGVHSIVMKDANSLNSAPISITITEPSAPTALNAFNVTFYNGMLRWTPQGNETTWNVQYGPAGFTLGSSPFPALNNQTNDTIAITGLTEDTDYQFYVQAGCISTSDWAGPFSFSTDIPFTAWDNQCGPGFTPIHTTGTALNLTDDQQVNITTVNPVSFQGVTSNTIGVNNNGRVYIGATTFNVWSVDLDDEEGNVYWKETTIGGDNYLIIEWYQRPKWSGVIGQNVTFEVAFNQTTGEIFYLYNDKVFGGTQSSYDYAGNFATISASGPVSTLTISSNSQTYLQNNSCVRFYTSLCPNVQNMVTTPAVEDAQLDWNAGLYGETNWTVVYGLDGFDPSVASEVLGSFSTNTSDAFIGGLTQLTCYDAYIYSECAADNLTSDGYLVNFCTKPNCSDITTLAGTTDVDSLELTWNWTASSMSYPVTGFKIQYGMTGFTLGSGFIDNAAGINFADTVHNTALMASGVYQVYVQAQCFDGSILDTSNWVGPITLVMPITNDVVCGQEVLQMNSVYTFNNTGAGVSTNESSIAPPATGAQTTTGWVNSTLNGTLWYTFVAPVSGSVRVNSTAIPYNGQAAVYRATNCADFNTFTMIAANDDAIGGTSLAPNFTVCGLTPGSTYYIMYDKFDATSGNFSLKVTEIVLEGGTALPLTKICYGANVDLFTTITGNNPGGTWSSSIPSVNASITGSDFESDGLAYTTFDLQYRVVDGCAYDSIVSQVKVYPPSNAGQDGSVNACKNEPVDLLSGLNGNVDLNGTWYNPSNIVMPNSQVTTANFPGQYNYHYISGNGVCPNDTANVVVTVTNCNWLSVDENALEEVTLYPNPSTGVVFIESTFTGKFDLVVTDINGRTVQTGTNVVSGMNSVNLKDVQRGTYFFKLSTESAEKVFRVVIQ